MIYPKYLFKKLNISTSLLSQYKSGTKKPSAKRKTDIFNEIKNVGKELSKLA